MYHCRRNEWTISGGWSKGSQMKTSGFLLFRLNFVDREDLFPNPIANDSDFIQVIEEAATEEFDVVRQGRRTSYGWALREVVSDSCDQANRPFIFVTFSYEVMSRKGPIITPGGIAHGTSTLSPPSATLVRILIDLKRHICAVEDVPGVIQSHSGWKTSLQTILSSAAWKLLFKSMIHLTPVVPAETVAVRLKSFEKVTRLRVTLSIPNPDLGPSFQRLYDEMKRGGVRELSQDMRNERGLTVAPDTLPQAALDMAMTGYRKGKIRLYGYKDGRKDNFTVADDVARIEIGEEQDLTEVHDADQRSSAVKRFAKAIIERIDESLSR
jgi:hypothetical protein